MSPRPPLQLPPAFSGAITELADGETQLTRAAACFVEAGSCAREIDERNAGDVTLTSPWSPSTSPAGGRICGQEARVVLLDRAATADREAVRDNLTAGFWAACASDVDDAVAALSAMGGTKLRAHNVRTPAAIRAAKATTAADRRRPQRRLEERHAGASP